MDLIEIWVVFNNRNDEHRYNGRQLTQLQYEFIHVTTHFNETEITTGLQPAYSVRKFYKTI